MVSPMHSINHSFSHPFVHSSVHWRANNRMRYCGQTSDWATTHQVLQLGQSVCRPHLSEHRLLRRPIKASACSLFISNMCRILACSAAMRSARLNCLNGVNIWNLSQSVTVTEWQMLKSVCMHIKPTSAEIMCYTVMLHLAASSAV